MFDYMVNIEVIDFDDVFVFVYIDILLDGINNFIYGFLLIGGMFVVIVLMMVVGLGLG